ncbi:MAG: biotin--[acetyl-CoA-carboxylase] ligase [Actinomycetota bacterium]
MDLSGANQLGRWLVKSVAETGSTNADLVAAAHSGAPDGLVLRADHQSAGRGRRDRTWEAPPGQNLLVSILFRTDEHPGLTAGDLVRCVSLAAIDACRSTSGAELGIKWPNDLLLGGTKIAGVLAHSGASTHGDFTVAGIGLNIGWSPPGAASLRDASSHIPSSHDLCMAMLAALDGLLALGSDALHDEYCAHLATVGERVRAVTDTGEITGRALAVERDGRLVVLDECAVTHRLDTADVVHLRAASP